MAAITDGFTLRGLGGDDVLIGSGARDILTGGDGDDILFGGLGNDNLTGNAGADTFRFAETGSLNSDTITDFVVGEDVIDLSDLLNGSNINENNVDNFVRVQDVDNNGVLQVKANGDWVDVATLTGHGTPGTVIDIKIDNEEHRIQII
ncbi:type I secretion C-terminal target domain-containing protein [Devosia sp.]|uniref:type I secretion C-terminal target domain-containing protein n=1 Tax=Devosia sp. TaxID=1871048 RepID=UPI0025EBBDCF|nr:type I secretion C-terminal target domain-containing protein [Devosia sp.]MCR6636348.1 type I secretion C-terminal target domain-containing protein [Devosia sp.]